jgi:hypothetical protein
MDNIEKKTEPQSSMPPSDPSALPNMDIIKGALFLILGAVFVFLAYSIILKFLSFFCGLILIYYGLVLLKLEQVTRHINNTLNQMKKLLFP